MSHGFGGHLSYYYVCSLILTMFHTLTMVSSKIQVPIEFWATTRDSKSESLIINQFHCRLKLYLFLCIAQLKMHTITNNWYRN